MSPNSYTELFFLDEVTALTAGHRPCFECRRQDAVRFLEAFAQARQLDTRPSAPDFDRVLHGHRLDGRTKRLVAEPIASLPTGAMIEWQGAAWAVHGQSLLKWTFEGYTEQCARPSDGTVQVITPLPMVEALRLGYNPIFHPSADQTVRA
ncbi:MAG: hypothetical protein AAGI06_19155 [Pseudomonadota bacterium]